MTKKAYNEIAKILKNYFNETDKQLKEGFNDDVPIFQWLRHLQNGFIQEFCIMLYKDNYGFNIDTFVSAIDENIAVDKITIRNHLNPPHPDE